MISIPPGPSIFGFGWYWSKGKREESYWEMGFFEESDVREMGFLGNPTLIREKRSFGAIDCSTGFIRY